MKNKFVLFLMLIFLTVSIAFSQQNCPTLDGFMGMTTTFYKDRVDNVHYEEWGSVELDFKRNIDGSIDVSVNWATLDNNNPYGLTDNELKGFMYMAIIKDLLFDCPYPTIVNISFYELSECKVDNPCYLIAEQTATMFCKDNLWPGPDPEAMLGYSGIRYWVILNKQSCGFKCCKTTYTVQCNNEHSASSAPTILSTSQSTYYDCPAPTILDCYFHTPKECNSTCPLIQELP